MEYDLNTHASASAIAKVLGIEFTQGKLFKELLMESDLETVKKSHVIKNKTVEYDAYHIIDAINFAYDKIDGNHVQAIAIDISWVIFVEDVEKNLKH